MRVISPRSTAGGSGTLGNLGGGRFSGTLTFPVNPVNITVRSSSGGSASRAVTVK
jgi:hypothetical protein